MSKEKLFFSFHSLLSSSLYISHNFLLLSLFFSSLLLALTHAVLQDCTNPHTLGLHFIHIFKWPNGLSFYFFIFSHSSHQVTINASPSTNFFSSALLQPNDPFLLLFSFLSSFSMLETPCISFALNQKLILWGLRRQAHKWTLTRVASKWAGHTRCHAPNSFVPKISHHGS